MDKNSQLDLKNNSHVIAERLTGGIAEFADHPQEKAAFERLLTLTNQIYSESLACKWVALEKASHQLLNLMNEMSHHLTQRTVDQILTVSSAAFEVQGILKSADGVSSSGAPLKKMLECELASGQNQTRSQSDLPEANSYLNPMGDGNIRRQVDKEIKDRIAREIRRRLDEESVMPAKREVSANTKIQQTPTTPEFLISENVEDDQSADQSELTPNHFFKIKISESNQVRGSIRNRFDQQASGDTKSSENKDFRRQLQTELIHALSGTMKEAAQSMVNCNQSSDSQNAKFDFMIPVTVFNSEQSGQVVFLFPKKTATQIASKMLGFSLQQLDQNVMHTVSALIQLIFESLQQRLAKQEIDFTFSISNMMEGGIRHYAAKQSHQDTLECDIPTVGLFAIETTLRVS